jgi:site-specific DNA recombinase
VCGGAYVGTGAHGRNGFYRYYVCRTRQKTGGRGCSSQRLPADDLEGAITEALVSTYGDYDLLTQAARDAYTHIRDEQPRLEAELAGTESQLRDTSAAIDRYLRAFEAGSMSDTLCAPRIVEPSERRTELTARRNELSVQVRASAPQLPSASQLRVTSEQLRRAMNDGVPTSSSDSSTNSSTASTSATTGRRSPTSGSRTKIDPGHCWPGPVGHRFVRAHITWS